MTSPSAPDPLASADRVDRGLAAGFGPPGPESAAGHSILAALEQRGGVTPRVLLRDAAEPGTPLLRPLPAAERAAATGRYQFQGEIAHGGMGVILKGHDQDLGRDVAIKVLHERYKDDASLLRRFVEEAQIGGQLQHPGIVPVYELGLHEGRPFFTMKLIKGRTLGALLVERTDPGQDRRRFLGIFEQVCQTMAYAHARGVIHRDLKPANVMVGAFGEVQVVDWGMAKVLAQGGVADERKARESTIETVRSRAGTPPGTSSIAGSVMGTPSYMPPEQATGNVERMDERSDVFALGAILCEIVTGAPPYAGSRDEALAAAAQGELAAARERLARCEAEAELGALVTECLAVVPSARPRDAQAVAARISGYLASAEQRAQAARIAAAEQAVKAREARRAHRLTLALAASVLVTVVMGGGGWLWIQGRRSVRGATIARQVDEALAEATRLRGQAEAGTADDLALWGRARTKAEAAQALAASDDADLGLRARAAGLVGELERGETEARRKAEQVEKDRAMVARLEEIPIAVKDERYPSLESKSLLKKEDARRREDAYRAAFAAYGLDLQEDEEAAAMRIGSSAIVKELAMALDDWSAAHSICSDDPEPPRRLRRVARRADPDPWRNRLRDCLLLPTAGLDDLRALASEADPASLPPATLLLLCRSLSESDGVAEAAALLRAAQRQHPSDFLITFELGVTLGRTGSADKREVVRFFTAATAIRPRSTEAMHLLGIALHQAGDLDGALALFRTEPPSGAARAHWCYHAGNVLKDRRDFAGAIAAYRGSILLEADDANVHYNLGCVLDEQGDLEGAIASYRTAVGLGPTHGAWTNLGEALLRKGDLEGAITASEQAIRLDLRKNGNAHTNLGISWFRKGDVENAVRALRAAVDLESDNYKAQLYLGDALHSKGDLEGAIEASRKAIHIKPDNPDPYNNLGCALHDLGDQVGAIKAHREAVRLAPEDPVVHTNLGCDLHAHGDLEDAIAAHREAIRLKPDFFSAHYNLGLALEAKGDHDGAAAAYRDAIRCRADYAEAWCNLGHTLRRMGHHVEALPFFERGHELGTKQNGWNYPSERWLASARTLAEEERPLLAIVRGEARATDAQQSVRAAACAARRKLHHRAAQLYTEAFAADPRLARDLKGEHCLHAARAAALAGCSEGTEQIADAERARCRQLALRCLRDDFQAWSSYFDGDPEVRRARVERTLQRWQTDAAFSGLRDPVQVETLPAAEQAECQAFWRDVQALLERAAPERPPESRR